MAELNGYFFRGLLKKMRRRFALSAGEQALYMELVDICNEEDWCTSFQIANGALTTALNCDEKTLTRWRQSLINAGLIKYKSGKSRKAFGIYEMLSTTVKIPTVSPTNVPTVSPTNVPTNVPDYNKLNKTKLNKRTNTNVFVPPALEEVKSFFLEKGYSEHSAIKAWEYYETGNWKDSKGKQVKNWKQKMIAVWFKDENKIARKQNACSYVETEKDKW